ncbi:hypothetical protein NE637_08325 [Desulfovibrio desulfuricans]|uniref:hypothetical protein n=1 Tax=Desulfovibrio desulfuricans TaxID=876 RepID=UPI00210D7D43|nr:hypothetical protein [Desulfovibrio desulfuricans]MCQ4861153.1 hypothetical protein [Desulfovibrio desulfuricans]
MLRELDDIRLTQAITSKGSADLVRSAVTLPAGTEGTVMSAYPNGAADVEFFVGVSDNAPYGYVLITLDPAQFERIAKNAV